MEKLKQIESRFEVVHNALFLQSAEMDYSEIIEAICNLCESLESETEHTEEVWYIGESGFCCLSDLIIGAFWHFTEWHSGQYSESYRALSMLGDIYEPGMTAGPEPESGEEEVYKALEIEALKSKQAN